MQSKEVYRDAAFLGLVHLQALCRLRGGEYGGTSDLDLCHLN